MISFQTLEIGWEKMGAKKFGFFGTGNQNIKQDRTQDLLNELPYYGLRFHATKSYLKKRLKIKKAFRNTHIQLAQAEFFKKF